MRIKMIVFDVDGTLTDGKIYMGPNGEVFKAFNAHDAVGIRKLKKHNIKSVIITGRESNIVNIRAKEMDISEVYQNITDKKAKLLEIVSREGLSFLEVAYIGDDENDKEAMALCGFKACPLDATTSIKKIADYISPNKASESAVREIIETKILGSDE